VQKRVPQLDPLFGFGDDDGVLVARQHDCRLNAGRQPCFFPTLHHSRRHERVPLAIVGRCICAWGTAGWSTTSAEVSVVTPLPRSRVTSRSVASRWCWANVARDWPGPIPPGPDGLDGAAASHVFIGSLIELIDANRGAYTQTRFVGVTCRLSKSSRYSTAASSVSNPAFPTRIRDRQIAIAAVAQVFIGKVVAEAQGLR